MKREREEGREGNKEEEGGREREEGGRVGRKGEEGPLCVRMFHCV